MSVSKLMLWKRACATVVSHSNHFQRKRESSIMNKYRPTIKSSDANDINTGFQMLIKSKENETVMQKWCLDHVASLKYHTDSKTWRRIDAKDAVLGFPNKQTRKLQCILKMGNTTLMCPRWSLICYMQNGLIVLGFTPYRQYSCHVTAATIR